MSMTAQDFMFISVGIAALVGPAMSIWNNIRMKDLHHEMNNMKDELVASAFDRGHLIGTAEEKVVSATIAKDAAIQLK